MKTHPRLTGLCLLLISMAFFFTIDLDKGGDVLGLCGFLLFFVSGWLVLIFFWNDGDITKLRRIHKEKTQGRAFQAMPVQERTFRYPAMRGARLAVMRLFMHLHAGNGHSILIFAHIQSKQSRRRSNGDTIFCVRVICFLLNIFLLAHLALCPLVHQNRRQGNHCVHLFWSATCRLGGYYCTSRLDSF